jgi:hypothetical protein
MFAAMRRRASSRDGATSLGFGLLFFWCRPNSKVVVSI